MGYQAFAQAAAEAGGWRVDRGFSGRNHCALHESLKAQGIDCIFLLRQRQPRAYSNYSKVAGGFVVLCIAQRRDWCGSLDTEEVSRK